MSPLPSAVLSFHHEPAAGSATPDSSHACASASSSAAGGIGPDSPVASGHKRLRRSPTTGTRFAGASELGTGSGFVLEPGRGAPFVVVSGFAPPLAIAAVTPTAASVPRTMSGPV